MTRQSSTRHGCLRGGGKSSQTVKHSGWDKLSSRVRGSCPQARELPLPTIICVDASQDVGHRFQVPKMPRPVLEIERGVQQSSCGVRCNIYDCTSWQVSTRHVCILQCVVYILAGEYMGCRECKGTYISWDERILTQLSAGTRQLFPVVLTRKYACDRAIFSLLRGHTLGNSPTALRNRLLEMHSEEWVRSQLKYLSDCCFHKQGIVT